MNGREPFPRLVVRPVRPDDEARLRRTFDRLSPQTIYHRFFGPIHAPPPGALRRFVNVDHDDREALVGGILTRMLVDEAVSHHIATLTATVLSDNTPVSKLLATSLGQPATVQRDGPQTRMTFRIAV